MRLNIGQVVAQRGFCFLWCGSAEGLDEGRKCLKAWGKEFVPKIRQFSHFLKIQNTVYSLVSFAILNKLELGLPFLFLNFNWSSRTKLNQKVMDFFFLILF